jgi:hypothetical protein
LHREVYHFSEDPNIVRFLPHVPVTNPSEQAGVWAIDAAHAPLYWFPRDCPRVTAWPRDASERAAFEQAFDTVAPRLHAIEESWRDRFEDAVLHRYTFDGAAFAPWSKASGQFIATAPVEPLEVVTIGGLAAMHERAGIDLRFVDDLWPLHDIVEQGPWHFGVVRMRNARPRRT